MGLLSEMGSELDIRLSDLEQRINSIDAQVAKDIDMSDYEVGKSSDAEPVTAKKKKVAKDEPDAITWMDGDAMTISGNKWLKGYGSIPATTLIVGEKPTRDDNRCNKVFTGDTGAILHRSMVECGVDVLSAYYTNAVKYMPPNKRSVNAADLKICRPMLMEEIKRVQPTFLLVLGANALKSIAGKQYTFSTIRGEPVPFNTEDGRAVTLFATYSPAFINHDPSAEDTLKKDLRRFAALQRGENGEVEDTSYVVISTVKALRDFCTEIFRYFPKPLLSLDCEWDGATWMTPGRYIRTVQLGFQVGNAVVINMRDPNGVPAMDDETEAYAVLKTLLEDPRVSLFGHNVISDGQWLASYGIDIRERVVFDTMLAEYIANESGPFGLEEITAKYTHMGHYERDLTMWVKAHAKECRHGYGPVPNELLHPYGAKDVDAPLRALPALMAKLEPFLAPRGDNGQYPSLWDITLLTQKYMYELEASGLKVDVERLNQMINTYQTRKNELRALLVQMAANKGMKDFNPAAPAQVGNLLFGVLGLTPVKTTGGKQWANYVQNEGIDSPNEIAASTDKTTLEILEDADPIVKYLLNYRRLDTACKNQLRYAEEDEGPASKGGGIPAKIWPDGRLHAHFSPLSETGRFRHSKPNVANWSKKAEGFMVDAFGGKDKVPPPIRSVIVPEDGHVIMEGDFKQAELFVLGYLSNDANMIGALTTPGKDLHDKTAIDAFGLQVYDAGGVLVPEEFLLRMAAQDMSTFEEFQKTLTYVDQKGNRRDRSTFKDTLRVASKSVNFGVPYSRGAKDIALQIKAETGSSTPLDQLEKEVADMIFAWKNVTYPDAWKYMEWCAEQVVSPGYLVNPWGRYRRFPKKISDGDLAGMQRQAGNFPIQSTVADTAMLAMHLMLQYRAKHNLHFKLINQIHDAIMIETPIEEVEQCKRMYVETMGSIDIPIRPGETLRLGVDVEVMTRWGEKVKKAKQ